ncbi:MAG: L,D-transpeptidase [Polyangiaceae bacterium]
MKIKLLSVLPLLVTLPFAVSALPGCAAASDTEGDDETAQSEDELQKSKDAAWLYTGPLPKLQSPRATASLKGHTVRVVGYLPGDTELPSLPHARTELVADGRLKVELVYPIATAGAGATNSRPGTYALQRIIPFRVDSWTTSSYGTSFTPWGGFPFIGYNNGIAFHGPITSKDNANEGLFDVWYLQRGTVSHGCNRMNGEHVLELSHILGTNMRKIYTAGATIAPPSPSPKVDVIADYDKTADGKYIDVDYPTDKGVVRPGVAFGPSKVAMFGSWVGTELPNGKDLPPSMAWEGGVSGKRYVFAEHAKQNWVCSIPKADISKVASLAAKFPNKELPQTICAKKTCVLEALRAGKDARAVCAL